jgi:hypothetical protein
MSPRGIFAAFGHYAVLPLPMNFKKLRETTLPGLFESANMARHGNATPTKRQLCNTTENIKPNIKNHP